MRVTILGTGALADTIGHFAERAGNTVSRPGSSNPADADRAADLLIITGSATKLESTLATRASARIDDAVVVDATIPMADKVAASHVGDTGSEQLTASFGSARIVRAFASIPDDALTAALTNPSPPEGRLAVPFAGDDRNAKARVAQFIRDLGLEPFDIGAASAADVLAPGGALWRKALTSVELLEAVGWLSGDG